VVCLATGLLVGVLWWLLAPPFAVEMVAGELQPSEPVGESRFGADAWFAMIAGVAGVLIALVIFTRHRHRPIATVCTLAVAGLFGSVVAWRLGVLLGPDPINGAPEDIADGTELVFPLSLGATGLLLMWPITAVGSVLLMCLLGNNQSRWRSASGARGLSRADRSVPSSPP
jgi:hypothetical protein